MATDATADPECVLTRLHRPGENEMLRLLHGVLRFASERKWVLCGGWAQHLYLQHATDGRTALYDVTTACGMSDVDAICVEPFAELVELGARLHAETGVQLRVACGMRPNLFHLQVNWGGATLVDATGVSTAVMASVPASERRLTLPTGGLRVRIMHPAVELAKLHFVVDNVFNMGPGDMQLAKRLRRIALIEAALLGGAAAPAALPTLAPAPPLALAILSTLGSDPDLRRLVARLPHDTAPPSIALANKHAARVLHAVCAAAERDAPGAAKLVLYAPLTMTLGLPCALTAMVMDGGGAPVLRVHLLPFPVPLEGERGGGGLPRAGQRFAAAHAVYNSLSAEHAGDAGAAAQRAISTAMLTRLAAAPPAVPSVEYACAPPVEPVYARHLKQRAKGRGCSAQWVSGTAGGQKGRAAIARTAPLDGQRVGEHACRDLGAKRDAMAAALRAAVAACGLQDNIMADELSM